MPTKVVFWYLTRLVTINTSKVGGNLVRVNLFLLKSELILKIFAFSFRKMSENLKLRSCLKVYSLEYKSQSERTRYASFRICFEEYSKGTRPDRQGRFKVQWLNVTYSDLLCVEIDFVSKINTKMFFYMTEIKLWNGWLTLNRLKFVYGRESCLEAFLNWKRRHPMLLGLGKLLGLITTMLHAMLARFINGKISKLHRLY
jgi:hypothetical protein